MGVMGACTGESFLLQGQCTEDISAEQNPFLSKEQKCKQEKETFGLFCIQSWSTHAARAWRAINNVRPFHTFREVIYYYYCVGTTLLTSVIKPLTCSNGSSLMSCLQGHEGFKEGKLVPSKMRWSWPAWESLWQGLVQIQIAWEQGRPLITKNELFFAFSALNVSLFNSQMRDFWTACSLRNNF